MFETVPLGFPRASIGNVPVAIFKKTKWWTLLCRPRIATIATPDLNFRLAHIQCIDSMHILNAYEACRRRLHAHPKTPLFAIDRSVEAAALAPCE